MNIIQNKKGVTLMEAMIATVIVALVAVAVLGTITQCIVFSAKADMVYSASLLAQTRIDVLKRFPFSSLETYEETSGDPTMLDIDGDSVWDFARTTEIFTDYEGYSGLTKVKVTVYRVEGSQQTGNSVVIEALYSKSATQQSSETPIPDG